MAWSHTTLALAALVLNTLASTGQEQSNRTTPIEVRVLNAHSGKPMRKHKFFVRSQDVETDDNGVFKLQVNLDEKLEFNTVDFLLWCDAQHQNIYTAPYSAKDIIGAGVVAPNFCGKAKDKPTPGVLILYMRPLHSWEYVKETGSTVKDLPHNH
jgi:hypothetical protein